jgi:hypothetical protein
MNEQLTGVEKLEALWQGKLSPKGPDGNPLPFQSSEAEKAYKDRIIRVKDAIEMKKLPDRVPITVFSGMFPWFNAGMTMKEAMYDYEKCAEVFVSLSRTCIGAPTHPVQERCMKSWTISSTPGQAMGWLQNTPTRRMKASTCCRMNMTR